MPFKRIDISHIKIERTKGKEIYMGRDNKQGKSNNKDSLPQTPKNLKIKPSDIREEFAKEFKELEKDTPKAKRK